jgi:acyl-coenzyme A thioesterase PaaI-like protein
MPLLELPHSADCLVCGRHNPHGLRLSLFVDTDTSEVSTTFTPAAHHVGFQNILHGGILMTVADETMAWAAIWSAKRLCLAAEFTSRFLLPARPGESLTVRATITQHRPRLLTAACTLTNPAGAAVAEATAKFFPLPAGDYPTLLTTLLPHPDTAAAASILRATAPHR